MPLFDKVKAGAAQAVQKAQEAGKVGQAKLDEIQAKRQLDGLYRELGAATYALQAGHATPETAADIERLHGQIAAHIAEHGEAASTSDADDTSGPVATPPSGPTGTASGDFKLD